jgi:hypothetical protein
MLVRLDCRAVDHHVFIVAIGSRMTRNLLDHAAFSSAL